MSGIPRAGTIRRDLSAFLWTLIRKSCLYVHPGARLLKCAPPFTASPFALINPEPSQATASKHRSPHSVRVRLRVRVRVGWSASGATAKPRLNIYVLYTWYQVLRYSSSTCSTFHRTCMRCKLAHPGAHKVTLDIDIDITIAEHLSPEVRRSS